MKAKKSLGQHFLTSNTIAARIARAGDLEVGEAVLEIGPGTGILTEALLNTGVRVIAIEKDDRALSLLEERFKDAVLEGKLVIIHGDALTLNPATVFRGEKYKIIANIPYYITGALIRYYLEQKKQPETMVFLVQKEVAERIAREKKSSLLSLSVKAYGDPTYVDTVKARFFKPQPKVDSAILKISNVSKAFFKDFDEKSFFELIRAGFSKKRKVLVSNLSTLVPKEKLKKVFHELSLSEKARAEELDLLTWQKLVSALHS